MTHQINLIGYQAQAERPSGPGWDFGPDPKGLLLGTRDSYGLEQLRLRRGPEWEGLAITATFYAPGCNKPTRVMASPEGLVPVPPEALASACLTRPGRIVFAGLADGVQRISCDLLYQVADHSRVEGPESTATPSVLEQAIVQTGAARDEATQAAGAAETSAQAAIQSAANAVESERRSAKAEDTAELAAVQAEGSANLAKEAAQAAVASSFAARTSASAAEASAQTASSARADAQEGAASAQEAKIAAKASAAAAAEAGRAAAGSAEASEASERAARDSASEAIRAERAALEYQEQAKEFANQAVGYAAAATYALGPDENGRFSFFIKEENE